MNVLIADDSAPMRQALVHLIEAEPDMRVLEAATGDEAVEVATAHLPDVAILDVHMPGNGVIAAGRIRGIVPGVKVIVLTGDDAALSEQDRDRLGLSDVLLKGVSNAAIIAAIRRAAGPRSVVGVSTT